MDYRTSRGCAVAVIAIRVIEGSALAGSLTPPAGPVAPTPGPEPRIAINATNTPGDADSVHKITQAGSYYLTGNLVGESGKVGIEITASSVTVDLMGYEAKGVAGSLDGVRTTIFGLNSVEVRNGTVAEWGEEGIDVYNVGAEGCRIAGIRAHRNGGTGINGGYYCTITDCVATWNLGLGIQAGYDASVLDCAASENDAGGIAVLNGCVVNRCTVYSNGGNGISTNSGSHISACSVQNNAANGIAVSTDCVVLANTCDQNGYMTGDGAGILATSNDNRIEGNNCTDNDRGIDVDVSGNFITRNTCSGNTTHFEVAAGNVILVVQATPAGAVSGSTGGAAPGSTDPNANFSY